MSLAIEIVKEVNGLVSDLGTDVSKISDGGSEERERQLIGDLRSNYDTHLEKLRLYTAVIETSAFTDLHKSLSHIVTLVEHIRDIRVQNMNSAIEQLRQHVGEIKVLSAHTIEFVSSHVDEINAVETKLGI